MAVNSFNAQNPPVNTKGDLFTFSTIPTKLGVGTNDQVLTADSSTATGLKWATPASGGMTQLASGTLSGNGVTLSSISQAYKHLQLVIVGATWGTGTDHFGFQVNGITSNSYFTTINGAANGTTYTSTLSATAEDANRIYINSQVNNTNGYNHTVVNYYDYASSNKNMIGNWVSSWTTATPSVSFGQGAFTCNGLSAGISSIRIFTYNANLNFNGGNYYLYGVQ